MNTRTNVGPFDTDLLARAYASGLQYGANDDLSNFSIEHREEGFFVVFDAQSDWDGPDETDSFSPNFAIECN